MPIRSRTEALAAFQERGHALAASFQEAMDDFYRQCGPIAHALEGWTRAGVIRDLAKEKFITLAAGDDDMRHHRKGNATSFSVGPFNFRIKKLTAKLRARANRTKAARDFDRNQTSLLLNDEPATTLYFGYAQTENDPQHPPLYLVCNDESGRHAWEPIPIVPAAAPVVAEITAETNTEPSRVKVKAGSKRKIADG